MTMNTKRLHAKNNQILKCCETSMNIILVIYSNSGFDSPYASVKQYCKNRTAAHIAIVNGKI